MNQDGLNIQNNNGDTALITALKFSKLDITIILIPKMNMDGIQIQDNDGYTALDTIVYNYK